MLLNYGVGEDSRVPWTARRSNQSILKQISPECSLEGLMLKLKLQYFVDTWWKRPWCWERLKAGEGDERGWDGWMASLTQWTTPQVGKGQGGLACCSPWVTKNRTRLSDWTELNWMAEDRITEWKQSIENIQKKAQKEKKIFYRRTDSKMCRTQSNGLTYV